MDKVMLITGGSRGIGAATARLAAKRGWDVAITYVENASAAEKVLADIRAAGRKGSPSRLTPATSMTSRASSRRWTQPSGVWTAFSTTLGSSGPLCRSWISLSTGLSASSPSTRRAPLSPHRKRHGVWRSPRGGHGGTIVHMSSIAAKLGGAVGTVDYGASKGALDSLTVGMAKELAAEGIRVNAVRPGLIDTEIHASAGDPGALRVSPPLSPCCAAVPRKKWPKPCYGCVPMLRPTPPASCSTWPAVAGSEAPNRICRHSMSAPPTSVPVVKPVPKGWPAGFTPTREHIAATTTCAKAMGTCS